MAEKWIDFLKKNKKDNTNKETNIIKENTITKTVEKTYQLFKEGFSINKIAEIRDLSISTIENHINDCLKLGLILEEEIDLPINIKNIILEKINELNGDISKLKIIKELCGDEITYSQIKYTISLM